MKKILALLLSCLFVISLSACNGKKYDSNFDDDDFIDAMIGDNFSWDIPLEEAEEYIKGQAIVAKEVEVNTNVGGTSVSDGTLIFNYGLDGKLKFVKRRIASGAENELCMSFGEWDKEDKDGYWWYGNIAGTNTEIFLFVDAGDGTYDLLEFYPAD